MKTNSRKKSILRTLISIRIKATIRNFWKNLPGNKKTKAGAVLIGILMLYLAAAFEFLLVMLWNTLAVFPQMGLTWLYFALSGVMALFLTVFMTVFMTQNQMYNATDNDHLLSMPISPGDILLSRMAVLLGTSLLTVLMITAPAVGVYIYRIGGLTAAQTFGVISAVVSVTLVAQAVSCLLGYLLHLVLRRVKNKAMGSMVFMILFLVAYFTVYSKINELLTFIITNGEATADFIRNFAAPFYSLGLACSGEVIHSCLLIVGAVLIFALMYWILSRTFLRSVKGYTANGGGKTLSAKAKTYRRRSPVDTVARKELRRLLTCPIYLTNTGLGVIMLAAVAVAVPFLKGTIQESLGMIPGIAQYYPLVIPAMICFLNGMACFTAPAVSLEGKSLWVMRSMPISGRHILLGKLKLHMMLTGTASAVVGAVISLAMGCGVLEVLVIVVLSAEIAAISGLLGLIYNLLMPNFTWLNEAVPCKQGMPVLCIMLTCMALPVMAGVGYYFLRAWLSPTSYLWGLAVLFVLFIALLLRVVTVWGGGRMESFQC